MGDILNQIDAVLADVTSCQCGCGQAISERGPSPWFVNEAHQANWDWRQVKAKSGIEEESAPVEAVVAAPLSPLMAAAVAAQPRCQTCGIWLLADEDCDRCDEHAAIQGALGTLAAVPSPSFTLADMEAASAAVRARFEDRSAGMTCGRCQQPTGNNSQGHYWAICNAQTGTLAERRKRHHFCCPPPAGCELVEENDETLARLSDETAPGAWWRRMLGGTR